MRCNPATHAEPSGDKTNDVVGGNPSLVIADASQRPWDHMPDWDPAYTPSLAIEHTMSDFNHTPINYASQSQLLSVPFESLDIFTFNGMTWPDFTSGV